MAEERYERTFSVRRLVPLVFGLEHGPQRGGRGSRQECQELWQEEHLGLRLSPPCYACS